ncbi:MAG TPA: hypothetical protein PLQ89_13950 [Phycisphaerae bacterium]|nr:hypothetical protein [Phycisphaerae bacterium]HOJ74105.1 hypothetical protein [Phycisphaerae bacterium]HOM50699.1 hypothetical protein [Phycisphaerae bacterium]HON66548.1 hypothetical protein [Phycisphaerae bacterium]HOQ86810.1 hypothetical protein [Phycisphaerae bacterium]
MKRFSRYAAVMMMGMAGAGSAWAGEASTSASATNGLGYPGTASATANYTGVGGQGYARTRTDTAGPVTIGRGLAVGFDGNSLDVSFSHALAPVVGPAYAGTFNMSIGTDGHVATSYGGTLAEGGLVRTAEAGGSAGSHGATAMATGHTAPGGRVTSRTDSYSSPVIHRTGYAATPMVRNVPASYSRPVANVAPARVQGPRPISIHRSSLGGWGR